MIAQFIFYPVRQKRFGFYRLAFKQPTGYHSLDAEGQLKILMRRPKFARVSKSQALKSKRVRPQNEKSLEISFKNIIKRQCGKKNSILRLRIPRRWRIFLLSPSNPKIISPFSILWKCPSFAMCITTAQSCPRCSGPYRIGSLVKISLRYTE